MCEKASIGSSSGLTHRDRQGDLVTLDIFKYTNCENMRPEPFAARFTPRTPEIADLVRREAEEAKEALKVYV